MVKYMKDKSGKIIGVIWKNSGKKDTATIAITGIVLLAVGLTAFAWWKTQPQMKLTQPRLSTCHTCGGR